MARHIVIRFIAIVAIVVAPAIALAQVLTVSGVPFLVNGVPLNVGGIHQPLGMNLAPIGYYEAEEPFLNILLSGGRSAGHGFWPYFNWNPSTSPTNEGASTGEELEISYDADGYPTSWPQAGLTATYLVGYANFAIQTAPGQTYPYGFAGVEYTVLYSGSGTVDIRGDATATITASGQTFTVATPSTAGIIYSIVSSTAGNHITNLAIVESPYVSLYQSGQIWHPGFVNLLKGLTTLRFLNPTSANNKIFDVTFTAAPSGTSGTISSVGGGSVWGLPSGTYPLLFNTGQQVTMTATLNSSAVTWTPAVTGSPTSTGMVPVEQNFASRSQLAFQSYSGTYGLPIDAMLQLASLVQADPWYNVPINWSNSDVASLGALLNTFLNANPSLNVYIELSNEVWNGAFPQNLWAQYSGVGAGLGTGYAANVNWYGMRVSQIAAQLATTLGSNFSRVYPVIGAQWANEGVLTSALSAATTYGSGTSDIKLATVAGYFGLSPNSTDIATMLAVKTPLDDFFACMTGNVGTVANGSHTYTSVATNGWLGLDTAGGTIPSTNSTYGGLAYYVNWLASNYPSIKLAAYESGLGLQGSGEPAGWGALLEQAVVDPRMGTDQTTYLDWWIRNVGSSRTTPNNLFYDIEVNSTSFVWGALQSRLQTVSPLSSAPPRWQSIQNFITP